MTLSLRQRVLLFVAVINVTLFGLGLLVLEGRILDLRRELLEEYSNFLVYNLRNIVEPGGGIRVAPILEWPYWERFDDAIIVSQNWEESGGRLRPRGAFLNPVGLAERPTSFDQQSVLRLIKSSVETREPIPGAGGLAIPIRDRTGEPWGGCWFSLTHKLPEARESLALLFPWFLATTVLLTFGTFWILRRFVLDPVGQLADGARRISAGDLGVRLDAPPRRDELAELIRVFNAMTAQVQGYNERLARDVEAATEKVRVAEASAMTTRRLAAMGELAAGIAHEINNPLGGLQNAVEALARPSLAPEKREQYLGLLRDGLERIRRIVSKLLRFTPRRTEAQPFDLLAPARDALVLCRHRSEALGVEVEVVVDGRALTETELEEGTDTAAGIVLGERSELGQAVLNLLVNALDALEAQEGARRLALRLTTEEESLVLVVEDNGPGMDPEALASAADLFFTTKEVGRGTGLGLAIAHRVVRDHGGEMRLESRPGEGFRATLVLPRWRPAS